MAEHREEGDEPHRDDAAPDPLAAFRDLDAELEAAAAGAWDDDHPEDHLDDDDVPPARPLLHPDDRIWRHPSELAARAAAPAPAARPRRRRGARGPARTGPRTPGEQWSPVLLAAAIGGLLCAGLVALADIGGSRTTPLARADTTLALQAQPVATRLPGPTGRERLTPADLADGVRRSVVALMATDGTTVRRGSAVVVLDGTAALTAGHLVAGTAAGKVALVVDGVERPARVVGRDADADLALVRFDGPAAPAVTWADAAGARPGVPAVAVAATAGSGPSVLTGSVSALNRSATLAGARLHGLLEIDRAPAGTAAGGALLDADGLVLGITLAGLDGAAGFGYAVPADLADDIARQLAATGRVARPWLGIDGADRGVPTGVVVRSVRSGSPAARTGIAPGDVITHVDAGIVVDMEQLLGALRARKVGDTVALTVWRGEAQRTVRATLVDRA